MSADKLHENKCVPDTRHMHMWVHASVSVHSLFFIVQYLAVAFCMEIVVKICARQTYDKMGSMIANTKCFQQVVCNQSLETQKQ